MRTRTKKLLTAVLSCVLVVCICVGGSLAFLTDSEKETNTFTVGRVDIILEEPNWDDTTDGKEVTPGTTQVKDPTVTEIEGSSYMRMIVTITDTETGEQITDEDRLDLILQTIRYDATYAPATSTPGTALVEGTSYTLADLTALPMVNPAFTEVAAKSTAGQYYFNYNDILNEGDKATLFTNIVIPSDWNQLQLDLLGQFQIEILAQAIQSDTFDNADAAFAALDAEVEANSILEDYGEVGGEISGNGGLTVSGIVPEGGVYLSSSTGSVLKEGEFFSVASANDMYISGDYVYALTSDEGWEVHILDMELANNLSQIMGITKEGIDITQRATYGAILESINDKPVVNMSATFLDCTALTTAPAIPRYVTDLTETFEDCTALTAAPAIPSGVTVMNQTFNGCELLTEAPTLPESVTDISYAFNGCTNLVVAPVIPSGVTNMSSAFMDCSKLATAPTIPNGVQNLHQAFRGCTALNVAPAIPASVTDMAYAFAYCTALVSPPDMSNAVQVANMESAFAECTALTTAPVIPSSVTNMTSTFRYCIALTGEIEVNVSSITEENARSCFNSTTLPITLAGSASDDVKALLAATSSNGNVTY